MTKEYTPTTVEVMEVFCMSYESREVRKAIESGQDLQEASVTKIQAQNRGYEAFGRWLNQVKAEAWDEGYEQLDYPVVNPYRKGQ